jgi:hypothetical protein
LNELLKGIIIQKYNYNVKILNTDTESKNFNKNYNFITNFIIVTEDFVNLLLEYFNNYEKTILYENKWDIIFGYQCLIIKNIKGDNKICLTFYEENKPNNIDFYLELDKEELKKHINLILNNNLFFYLGLINFHHNDKYKEIFDNKGNNIGIFIYNCESNRSQFLEGMKNSYINNNCQFQQIREQKLINIEMIPKIDSIFEFKKELILYSQDIKNKKENYLLIFLKYSD